MFLTYKVGSNNRNIRYRNIAEKLNEEFVWAIYDDYWESDLEKPGMIPNDLYFLSGRYKQGEILAIILASRSFGKQYLRATAVKGCS